MFAPGPRRFATTSFFLLISMLCSTPATHGFVGDDHARYDVNRLEFPNVGKSGVGTQPHGDVVAELQASPAWLAWNRAHPGWRVTWNTWTRTPHRAFGPGVRLEPAGGRLTQSSVEQACRDFLASNAAWLGVQPAELSLVHARQRRERWYVTFQQEVLGIPVRGGRADLRLGAGGEVALVGVDWFPNVAAPRTPNVSVAAALTSASDDLRAVATDIESALLIVPRRTRTAAGSAPGARANGDIEYVLAHELRFRTSEPLGSWYTLVDAQSGELLYRENLLRFLDIEGRVTASVERSTVDDPPATLPLRDTRVDLPGGTEFGITDANGDFQFASAHVDAVTARVRLEGTFARIVNFSLGNATPQHEELVTPGMPHTFQWDDMNSRVSERDAYYHTLVAHNYIKQLDPDFDGLDYVMPVVVDINTRECNAWWNGFSINFLEAGDECVNTARIADVVYHEYGHGVTHFQYFPLRPSGAMHEAFSDYIAATITSVPTVGNGFRGPGTIIRSIDNTNRYPDDVVGEVHRDGLILGGALWDLREALGAETADVLWHFARYGLSETFDDYLLDVLVTDDDNANVYDGTPNFDAIIEAFRSHGIGDYDVHITHAPLADTEDDTKPLTIDASIVSIFQLEPQSARLVYRTDGGAWTDVALVESSLRQFSATIPQQVPGTRVEYYLTATDVEGRDAALPAAGPDGPYAFHVGTDTTPPVITFMPLGDRPADADSWRIEAHVTDNLDQPLDNVVLEYSLNSAALDTNLPLTQGEDDRWWLQLPVGGAMLGDAMHYRIRATDGAQVPNVQTAPPADSYSFNIVSGWLRDFEANNGALAPTGDWAWGEPHSGPGTAFSGTRLWGTNLSGNHADNMNARLVLPDVDLTGWSSAALAFRHWYLTEAVFDGGRVEVSSNGGASWNPLLPNGGYPTNNVIALQGPGYDAQSAGWELAEFDLTSYLGQSVMLRLRYASDQGVNAPGWFVDDLEVVERQVLGVPLEVVTQSGENAQVTLSWSPPAGTNPLLLWDPVLGYHVYRSTQPDLSDAVRVTGTPLSELSFVDAGLVNGTPYWYAVSALYDEGESTRTDPVEALPFVARYASEVTELDIVNETATLDTAVVIQNVGTGFLRANVFLGDEGQSLDEVRIAYDIPDGSSGGRTLSAFELLFTDTPDPDVTPDIKELWAEVNGSELRFRVTGYRAWGTVVNDFTMAIGLDTDTNLATGEDGFDYFVLIGRFPMQNLGAAAVVITAEQDFVGVPPHRLFPPNTSSLEVGFPLDFVGTPSHLYVGVGVFLDDVLDVLSDRAPNEPASRAWLTPAAPFIEVPAGEGRELGLRFSDAVPPAVYRGIVLLETNDPERSEVGVPVTYRFVSTPVRVADLSLTQERADVVVRWLARDERDVAAYRVLRSRGGAEPCVLHPEVAWRADGVYTFRDASPEPGRYTYHVAEVTRDGDVVVHGAMQLDVVRAVPARTFLDPAAPNPFNPSTTLAYGVAEPGPMRLVVYDARGRRVRTLAQSTRALPGFYRALWDGRDDSGRRVASGVYHARLVVNGRALGKRLTLLK